MPIQLDSKVVFISAPESKINMGCNTSPIAFVSYTQLPCLLAFPLLFVTLLHMRIEVHKCSWTSLVASDGHIVVCLVHIDNTTSHLIGINSNSEMKVPSSPLTSLFITSPVDTKSIFASSNHCFRLSWVFHFALVLQESHNKTSSMLIQDWTYHRARFHELHLPEVYWNLFLAICPNF